MHAMYKCIIQQKSLAGDEELRACVKAVLLFISKSVN